MLCMYNYVDMNLASFPGRFVGARGKNVFPPPTNQPGNEANKNYDVIIPYAHNTAHVVILPLEASPPNSPASPPRISCISMMSYKKWSLIRIL